MVDPSGLSARKSVADCVSTIGAADYRARAGPAQDVGYEVAAFEGFCVAPVRRLLVRGAVDIIEDRAGQSPLGQTPKIMKVMTIA